MPALEPLTKDRAKKELNRCLERGEVFFSRHFREELAKDNLANSDIITVCQSGLIYDSPELDVRTRHWKYRIEGTVLDGRRAAVVFRFDPVLRAVFITVFAR